MTSLADESSLLAHVFPLGAQRSQTGALSLGGLEVTELAREFGTPLYIYDEATLRDRCRRYVQALARHYSDGLALFAAKAYIDPTVARLVADEGLGLDAVSSGELRIARAAGFPMERAVFHGNNKLSNEIAYALQIGIGRIVIDSLDELDLVNQVAAAMRVSAPALLRVTPGVEAHTHDYIRTGAVDSKFGIGIGSGAAEEAVARAQAAANVDLMGLHAHIGSQIFDIEPYEDTVEIVLDFAERMRHAHDLRLRDFSPGGGVGVRYVPGDDPPDPAEVVEAVARTLSARKLNPAPRLLLEPGRSIVARAGVALYRVGTIKTIPNVRTYVSVDGGMADNIRPALYGARYSALLANRESHEAAVKVTIAGRYCESGDVLLRDVELPPLRRDDLIAMPTAGAYHLAMASNYNMVGRPAAVMIRDGRAILTRKRETDDDLLRLFPATTFA